MWNYYRDKPNNPAVIGDPPAANYNADAITNYESFRYKSSIKGNTLDNDDDNDENNNRKKTKMLKLQCH